MSERVHHIVTIPAHRQFHTLYLFVCIAFPSSSRHGSSVQQPPPHRKTTPSLIGIVCIDLILLRSRHFSLDTQSSLFLYPATDTRCPAPRKSDHHSSPTPPTYTTPSRPPIGFCSQRELLLYTTTTIYLPVWL